MKKIKIFKKASNYFLIATMGISINAISTSVSAKNIYKNDDSELNFDFEAAAGYFSSAESYGNPEAKPKWSEGYAKYGLSGSHEIGGGAVFGSMSLLTSATWGDGDASFASDGSERETDIEDLYIGYRGDNFEISIGRQNLTFGDGLLLAGDGLNLGAGIDPELDRGGAYWLAPRKAFDKSILVKLGGEEGLRSDIFWFKSDNKGLGRSEMAGINLEHVTDNGTFGAMFLKGLSTDPTGIAGGAFDTLHRDGQEILSIRYQGNAGVENLFLSTELINQKSGGGMPDGNGWYAEAAWTFADTTWSPMLSYRYSSFDNDYDQLYSGFSRGYGTWFQGEVWSNYASAGPSNTGVDIQQVHATVSPYDTLTFGALYHDYDNSLDVPSRTSAKGLDLYAFWIVNEYLMISPLIGFYKPDSPNGIQGNSDTNTYFQLISKVAF